MKNREPMSCNGLYQKFRMHFLIFVLEKSVLVEKNNFRKTFETSGAYVEAQYDSMFENIKIHFPFPNIKSFCLRDLSLDVT